MKLQTFILILTMLSCASEQQGGHETKIDLRGQKLKVIPDSVFAKTELVYLNLGTKETTFYPPLSAMHDRDANELSELSNKIGKLTSLKTLILFSNKLTSLPNDITKLINLEILDLSSNRDFDILKEIDKIKRLHNLKVLKIVDVKLNMDDTAAIQTSLNPATRIIFTIPEYFESLK